MVAMPTGVDHITLEYPAVSSSGIQRFGHSTIRLSDRLTATFGGFGEVDGKHRRIQDITVMDMRSFETYLLHPDVNPKEIEGVV